MDRWGTPLTSFLPLLIIAVMVVIGLRMAFGGSGSEVEEDPRPPRATRASLYQPQGVVAGHRLACDGPGAEMDGPQTTVALPTEIFCALDPAPLLIDVLVAYDVNPQGHATNVTPQDRVPLCIEREINRAVSQWRYCPLMVRGEPQWRYGETVLMSFSRRD